MKKIGLMISGVLTLAAAGAQLSRYGAVPVFQDRHHLYVYRKSNWDGTHASRVYLYIADSNRLQSFKWTEGDVSATLVTAEFDWNQYSVSSFTNHRLEAGKAPRLVAKLQTEENGKLKVEAGAMRDSLWLSHLPWQSYDFDFAGLGFAWRGLQHKKEDYWVHIADAAMVKGDMRFVNKGRVDIHFREEQILNGRKCLLYDINGPGLDNKGGQIWVNADTWMIEAYKIRLPDEPGFENGYLELEEVKTISPAAWEAIIRSKTGS